MADNVKQPAMSALRVALRRAAHQLVDWPVVFHDPFAVRLLGAEHAEALRRTPARARWSRSLRAFAVARSLCAEEQLALAVALGVRQYCLLGAGLDTFAWRNPFPGLRVWEVDRPETQAFKVELTTRAGLPAAARCAFVSADLGDDRLPAKLREAGWQSGEPSVFAMLGVAPYLANASWRTVLALVGAQGGGSVLVLDYRLPRAALGEEEQRQHDSLAARVAARGEPFRSSWTADGMAAELREFASLEDLGSEALNRRYFAGRADGLAVLGRAVRVVSAQV